MKGYIYIAGAFDTVNRSVCGRKGSWIDNDPHFWTSPPTWGICRNDLRAKAEEGDYVIFVLPRHAQHPQMIFAVLRIAEKIRHSEAFFRKNLRSKRMGNKTPNGNIIVDAQGGYNRFDVGVHRRIFEKIRRHYAIGSENESRMLTAHEINQLAPTFVENLGEIVGIRGPRAIDIISRHGRELSARQVRCLLRWIDSA